MNFFSVFSINKANSTRYASSTFSSSEHLQHFSSGQNKEAVNTTSQSSVVKPAPAVSYCINQIICHAFTSQEEENGIIEQSNQANLQTLSNVPSIALCRLSRTRRESSHFIHKKSQNYPMRQVSQQPSEW